MFIWKHLRVEIAPFEGGQKNVSVSNQNFIENLPSHSLIRKDKENKKEYMA